MDNNKKSRLGTNMISYAVLQIVNMLVGLFLPRLYLAVYGSETNGVISTINSFTTYFAYLEAGIGLTLIHSLFKPLAENNTGELNGILSFSKRQYQKISYMYFGLVMILSVAFPLIKSTDAMGIPEFMSLVFVIGLYGAIDFYTMSKYRVLLTADRKEYVISNATTLAQLLRFVLVWAMLQFELSVVFVKIIPIFTLLIRSLILRIYVKRKYPDVNFSSQSKVNIAVKSNRWDALLLQISISTSISLPTIIISQVLGFKEANVYAVYSLVISAMISIISALSSGVSPMLGLTIAQGKDISKTYNLYDYIVSFALTLVFSVTVVMIIPFIKIYTSVADDINYVYPLYAVLISVWAALYSYRIPLSAVINAAGIYRENRINNIVNLAIQVVLGIIAAIVFGIAGLLVVMIISAIQRNVCLGIVNSRKFFDGKISKNISRQIIMSAMIVISWLLSELTFKNLEFTVFTWVVTACIVGIIELFLCTAIFTVFEFSTTKDTFIFIKKRIIKR